MDRPETPDAIPPSPNRRTRRYLLGCAKLVVSGALIWWLLRDTAVGEVLRAIRSADLFLFFCALALYGFRYVLGALRWRLLLEPYGSRPPIRYLFASSLVAVFFSNFLPSTIGGEGVRVYDSWRAGLQKSDALFVILMDRAIGLFALLLIALAAAPFSLPAVRGLGIPYLIGWLALGLAAVGALMWALFGPRALLGRLLERFQGRLPERFQGQVRQRPGNGGGAGLTTFRSKRGFARILLLSLAIQVPVILHYYVLIRAVGPSPPWLAFFFLVPVAVLVMTLPISINGIGVREHVFVLLLARYGVSKSEAIAFSWLAYVVVLLVGLAGGILLATRKEGRRRTEAAPGER